jgi:membrane-associated phospholipid phosphatase
LIFAFPILISLSRLFTKQHFIIDVPAGLASGWVSYEMFLYMVELGYQVASIWQVALLGLN